MLTNLCGVLESELTDIPSGCLNMGQVQKLAFRRRFSSGTTKNKFVIASANPNAAASWTTPLTASDGTKITISPTVHNPQNEAGQVVTFGSGNEVAGGVPIVMGIDPGKFTCKIYSPTPAQEEALRSYIGEDLTVTFITESGNMYMTADANTSPTDALGIPVQQFMVYDRMMGGRNAPDEITIEFYLPAGWASKLYQVIPATGFNPLTDLVNS